MELEQFPHRSCSSDAECFPSGDCVWDSDSDACSPNPANYDADELQAFMAATQVITTCSEDEACTSVIPHTKLQF